MVEGAEGIELETQRLDELWCGRFDELEDDFRRPEEVRDEVSGGHPALAERALDPVAVTDDMSSSKSRPLPT